MNLTTFCYYSFSKSTLNYFEVAVSFPFFYAKLTHGLAWYPKVQLLLTIFNSSLNFHGSAKAMKKVLLLFLSFLLFFHLSEA